MPQREGGAIECSSSGVRGEPDPPQVCACWRRLSRLGLSRRWRYDRRRVNVEANKALVRRFYGEVWGRGNIEFAKEVFADDYVRHDLRPAKAAPGPAGQALIAEQFRRAFPDLGWRVDLVLGEEDLVAARWTASGTHSGTWGDVAPTGKRATFSGVNIFRFGDEGKVVEIWNHRDDLGLREQLGASVFAGAPTSAER
jgi:steroid delta-isomerase-like uncharacterized protein